MHTHKFYLVTVLFLTASYTWAQVGIGTTDPQSTLHVEERRRMGERGWKRSGWKCERGKASPGEPNQERANEKARKGRIGEKREYVGR